MGNDWLAVPRMDVPGWNVYEDEHHLVAHVVWEADARFIASAPGLVSRLTAESEAAKREIERLTRELDAKQQMYASLQGHFDRTVSACKAALEQRDAANAAASELQRQFDRAIALGETLKSQRDAARRAGRAEGLREAAKILRNAAEADARNAVHCSAPNHRERFKNLSENELVMAQRMLSRAEEVERDG